MRNIFARIYRWFISFFGRGELATGVHYPEAPAQKVEMPKFILPRVKRPCLNPYCDKPMMVAIGQIAYTHKECRTQYRRIKKVGLARA